MRAIIDLGPYALVAAANAVRKVEARRKAPVVLAIGKIEGGERPVACEGLPHLLAGCRSGLVVAAKSRGRVLHRVVRLGQFGDERLYCMGWGRSRRRRLPPQGRVLFGSCSFGAAKFFQNEIAE